ncbi:MAG: hypothetical protein LBH44_00545 [Treponema sp.]|jgi:hypothetical protein|nr:hypothetical protein [Treponema sp.]
MLQSAGKKRNNQIMAAVLTVAVFGTFAFSITEIPNNTGMAADQPCSTGIFATMDHTMDCLAEDIHTVGRSNKASSSTQRNGIMRLLMPVEIYDAAEFTAFTIHAVNFKVCPNSKNTIHLNLRI